MVNTFSRQELYDMVWSQPISSLAVRFEVSDTGLANICKKYNIPRPDRGYWAKRKAGKNVFCRELPARGPGMFDEVQIGGTGRWGYRYASEEEILNSDYRPPEFEDNLDDVAERVKFMVGKITIPKNFVKAHRKIQKLLQDDDVRREEAAKSSNSYSWDMPIFDHPVEQRRLRIINGIFIALEHFGMKPDFRGKEARDLSVKINDQYISIWVEDTTQRVGRYGDRSLVPKKSSSNFKFMIMRSPSSSDAVQEWEDDEEGRIESKASEIVSSLIIYAEQYYREGQISRYKWFVGRKADLIEEIKERKERAKREERERLERLENDRIQKLINDAELLRKANDIRAYVQTVQERCRGGDIKISASDLSEWSKWAASQADSIDPVLSGVFLRRG